MFSKLLSGNRGLSATLMLLLCICLPANASHTLMDLPDPVFTHQHHYHTNELSRPQPLSNYGNPSYYHVNGKRYHVIANANNYDKVGIASWYGTDFHGKLTANREVYDMHKLTAASKTLPLPSYVKVTNLENGKHIIVRVNDRGPYKSGRILDLSYAAAKQLEFVAQGTTKVRVTMVSAPDQEKVQHYLQVASFSHHHLATAMRTKVANLTSMPVRIHPTKHPKHGTLYRIEIGPYASSETLHQAQVQLKQEGFTHTIAILG